MPPSHPFDRYAAFTDVAALKAFSEKPLRKSVRVNTLKVGIDAFEDRAARMGWSLEPVPWCREGFFIDRQNRDVALGKDIWHLAGAFYMQEAASMLPPALLSAAAGESVLDLCAAPGSKTTQVAAMAGDRAVIVGNDVQEKRLWTLKSSLYRSGVTSALVTRKVGQWFGKHMTERFDRVLCDAPCTAQGTARKDSDALQFCSIENIEKMARLQGGILEAAVHAAKVGGAIVYSTCTLTPEENEGVIASVLNKFSDQLEVVDPRQALPDAEFSKAIAASARVQEHLGAAPPLPFLRIWPQEYDTEGFFAAVLRKRAPTRDREEFSRVPLAEDAMPRSRSREIADALRQQYGTSFLREDDRLLARGEQLIVAPAATVSFALPVLDYGLGLPFAKLLTDGRVRLSHEMAILRGAEARMQRLDLSSEQLAEFLAGRDAGCDAAIRGDHLLFAEGICIGRGLAKEGRLKNNLPRWMILP